MLRCSIDRRAGLEEQPDDLEVAVLARDVQRREAVLIGLADRRIGHEEQLDALDVALLAHKE